MSAVCFSRCNLYLHYFFYYFFYFFTIYYFSVIIYVSCMLERAGQECWDLGAREKVFFFIIFFFFMFMLIY